MKTTLHLNKLILIGETLVANNLDVTPTITVYDGNTGNKVTVTNSQSIYTLYARTNKLRETKVTVVFDNITSLVYINAMNKDQYFDIDEYITINISITIPNAEPYKQMLQLYNYDYNTTISLLPNNLKQFSKANFDYLYIPFSDDIFVFQTNNALNTELNYYINDKLISNNKTFIVHLYNTSSIECKTILNTFDEYGNIINTSIDSYSKTSILKPVYFPEVIVTTSSNVNNTSEHIDVGVNIMPNFNLNFSKVSKFYKDNVEQYPYISCILNVEILRYDGNVEYKQSFLVDTTNELVTRNLFYFIPTEPGDYTINTTIEIPTTVLNLVHSSNITFGKYIAYMHRPDVPLFNVMDITLQSQIDDIKTTTSGYFLPVIDPYLETRNSFIFDLIPIIPGDTVKVDIHRIDEYETVIQEEGLNILYYDDETISITSKGIIVPKYKTYSNTTTSTMLAFALHSITEKYQNIIEVKAYGNVSIEVDILDDNKIFQEAQSIAYIVRGESKLITLSDGIYNVIVSDLNGVANYVYICYPTLLNGNMKYLKELLENVPQNPHKTYYDFNVFVTLKDLLMKKLNNMYATHYVYNDISDDLLSDLYTFKQIIDNINKYVLK